MEQVGLFVISEPSNKFIKQRIMNVILDIIEDDFTKVVFCDDENGNDMLYAFLNKGKQELLREALEQYNVLISYEDVTRDFLYQNNLNPIFEEREYKETLMSFLESNLDSDTVLDKITDMGMSSLNEIDYKFLGK